MKPILEIQHISKKYRIGHLPGGYLSLRERMISSLRLQPEQEDFWALRDISFTVNPGETLGIIGRNGAGKSTLLKILSKITPPTSGRMISRGRIASLLEVGTGFHPELTGRENIFFNGSLLGMKRREIEGKFDEIVDFSGVEKFLDTPLKHFSSGMQLRLAFAVAAFLEPEILIIDEVLAVGDAEFQKKCLGKMEDVSKSGRTILFVSHNLDVLEELCSQALLLKNGILAAMGRCREVTAGYLEEVQPKAQFHPLSLTEEICISEFSLHPERIESGTGLSFCIRVACAPSDFSRITDLCLLFYNYKRQRVAIYDIRRHLQDFSFEENLYSLTHRIAHFNLVEGKYAVGLFWGVGDVKNDVLDICSVEVKGAERTNQQFTPYDVQYRGFVELS